MGVCISIMSNGKQELIDYFSVFRPEYVEFATGELYVKKIHLLKEDLIEILNSPVDLDYNTVFNDLFIVFPEPFNLNKNNTIFEDLKNNGYTINDLDNLARDYSCLLETFLNGDNIEKEEAITTFAGKNYAGIDSGFVSPALYLLDSDYLVISDKVVDICTFLAKIIDYSLCLDTSLLNYVESNREYKKFIVEISDIIPELSDYEIFNMFIDFINDKRD